VRCKALILVAITALAGLPVQAKAGGVTLGSAGSFAILAGTSVTNTGATVINGNVGIYPGSTYTGFSTVTGNYTIYYAPSAVAMTAQSDLSTAYNYAKGLSYNTDLTGTDLGSLSNPLTPGVYYFQAAAALTGTLYLNDEGNPNAQFVFQIGTTLTTAIGSQVIETNTGGLTPGSNVFWQVGTTATLLAGTAFEGNILANSDITVGAGATILDGSALSMTGAVTLDGNNNITDGLTVPEPATITLALIAGALLGLPALAKGLRARRSRNEF